MCGIGGILVFEKRRNFPLESLLNELMAGLKCRGPDAGGKWTDDRKRFGLVNTRLAIEDPQKNFALPFRGTNNHLVLAYNGELYNSEQLKNRWLEPSNLSTKGDTEVFLKCLEKKGFNFLNEMDGVWAFALFDKKKHSLTLGRDLLGEKPLYFFLSKEYLIFCSEIKPICKVLKKLRISVEPWDAALLHAFSDRACLDQATLVKHIQKIQPGELITWNDKYSPGRSRFVQRLTTPAPFPIQISDHELCEELKYKIRTAVRSRIPKDVRFCTTLSGGVDSNLVNWLLGEHPNRGKGIFAITHPRQIREKSGLSENDVVKQSARANQMAVKKIFLKKPEYEKNYLEAAKCSEDGIFCDGVGAVACLAEAARLEGAKVLLMSDGLDELFLGYPKDLASICQFKDGSTSLHELRPFHRNTSTAVLQAIFSIETLEKHGAALPTCWLKQAGSRSRQRPDQALSQFYCRYSIPNYTNLRADRGSMMHSIEVRQPFLQRSFVEYCLKIPFLAKCGKGRETKSLLRRLLSEHLGPTIAAKPKVGFAFPFLSFCTRSTLALVRETVFYSPALQKQMFQKKARDFLIRKENERELWMAFCYCSTFESQ